MLVGGPQCTTRRRRYPFLPKRRRGVLVHERVLARGKAVERYPRWRPESHSLHPPSVSHLVFVYHVRRGTICIRQVPPGPDLELEEGCIHRQRHNILIGVTTILCGFGRIRDLSNNSDVLCGGRDFLTTLAWSGHLVRRMLSSRTRYGGNVPSLSHCPGRTSLARGVRGRRG